MKLGMLIKFWFVLFLWQCFAQLFPQLYLRNTYNYVMACFCGSSLCKICIFYVFPGGRPVKTEIAGLGQMQLSLMVWALGQKSFRLHEGKIFPTSPSEGDQTYCPAGMFWCISFCFKNTGRWRVSCHAGLVHSDLSLQVSDWNHGWSVSGVLVAVKEGIVEVILLSK